MSEPLMCRRPSRPKQATPLGALLQRLLYLLSHPEKAAVSLREPWTPTATHAKSR